MSAICAWWLTLAASTASAQFPLPVDRAAPSTPSTAWTPIAISRPPANLGAAPITTTAYASAAASGQSTRSLEDRISSLEETNKRLVSYLELITQEHNQKTAELTSKLDALSRFSFLQ